LKKYGKCLLKMCGNPVTGVFLLLIPNHYVSTLFYELPYLLSDSETHETSILNRKLRWNASVLRSKNKQWRN